MSWIFFVAAVVMIGIGCHYAFRSFAIAGLAAVAAIILILMAKAVGNPLPQLVNDYAGVLTPAQEGELITQLRAVERMAGNPQMVVVLPATLGGKDVAAYSGELARASKIGRKGIDNGILLLVAPVERKIRIEVGYGLEGAIPDARASRIIDGMKPFLKKGNENWHGAIAYAITQIRSNLKE